MNVFNPVRLSELIKKKIVKMIQNHDTRLFQRTHHQEQKVYSKRGPCSKGTDAVTYETEEHRSNLDRRGGKGNKKTS